MILNKNNSESEMFMLFFFLLLPKFWDFENR